MIAGFMIKMNLFKETEPLFRLDKEAFGLTERSVTSIQSALFSHRTCQSS